MGTLRVAGIRPGHRGRGGGRRARRPAVRGRPPGLRDRPRGVHPPVRRRGSDAGDVADRQVDWPDYLAGFHAARPGSSRPCCPGRCGATTRRTAGSPGPSRPTPRSVSTSPGLRPDGPRARAARAHGRRPRPLRAELRLARRRGAGPRVRADARVLPFRDGSVDVVTSALGLVVVQPLAEVLAEVARVLRPGGVLAAIAPALRPLGAGGPPACSPAQRPPARQAPLPRPGRAHRLQEGARRAGPEVSRTSGSATASPCALRRRRPADLGPLPAETPAARVAAAIDYLRRRPTRGGVEIAIPVRRLVAIK